MTARGFIVAGLVFLLGAASGARAWDLKTELEPIEPMEETQPEAMRQDPVLVPVPRVTIYPGELIRDDMLVDRDFLAEGQPMPKVFSVREALVGKVSRQTLLPKVAVSPSAVREPFTVKQGQPAVAVFKSGPLVISAVAVPLESGSIGDAISLRNAESGSTIRGVVQADGTVRVGAP